MVCREPAGQIAFAVELDHSLIAYPIQLPHGVVVVADVFEHVERVDPLENLVSERNMAYVGEYEVWNFGFGFLNVTVCFALQIIKKRFSSLPHPTLSFTRQMPPNRYLSHLAYLLLENARVMMGTIEGQND